MANMKDTGTAINVRGLEPEIVEALEASAQANHRTREGEARVALHAWVKGGKHDDAPLGAAASYCRQVGHRLTQALTDATRLQDLQHLTPSMIAEALGEAMASPFILAFSGSGEITFPQLDLVANYFGVNSEWLKHGTGTPYSCTSVEVGEKQADILYELLDDEPMLGKGQTVQWRDGLSLHDSAACQNDRQFKDHIAIIRTLGHGDLYIVHYAPGYPRRTVSHIATPFSEHGDIDKITRLVECFKKISATGSITITSGIIGDGLIGPPDTLNHLHPGFLQINAEESSWLQDILDNNLEKEHWPGFFSLAEHINHHP